MQLCRIRKARATALAVGVAAAIGVPSSASAAYETPSFDALIEGMDENSWRQVSVNYFDDNAVDRFGQPVWTPPALRTLRSPRHILPPWSSLGWDSERAQLILFGGGHANYEGNDVYTWHAESGRWGRASLPSALSPIEGTRELVPVDHPQGPKYDPENGSMYPPQSAHTYAGNQYLPVVDRFITFGGDTWVSRGSGNKFVGPDGVPGSGPFLWDPSKADPWKVGGADGTHVISAEYPEDDPRISGGNMWRNMDSLPDAIPQTTGVRSATVVENGRDVVYLQGPKALWRYEVWEADGTLQDNWSVAGDPFDGRVFGVGAAAVDPDRQLFVTTLKTNNNPAAFDVYDLTRADEGANNRAHQVRPILGNADGTPMLGEDGNVIPVDLDLGFFGIQWRAGTFYLWGSEGTGAVFDATTEIYAMDVPEDPFSDDWVMRLLLDGDVEPDAPREDGLGGGILGKFKYLPKWDVFLGVSDACRPRLASGFRCNETPAGGVWAYKPENWQGIDGLVVAAPAPPALLSLAVGLAGLAAAGRIRRRSAAA